MSAKPSIHDILPPRKPRKQETENTEELVARYRKIASKMGTSDDISLVANTLRKQLSSVLQALEAIRKYDEFVDGCVETITATPENIEELKEALKSQDGLENVIPNVYFKKVGIEDFNPAEFLKLAAKFLDPADVKELIKTQPVTEKKAKPIGKWAEMAADLDTKKDEDVKFNPAIRVKNLPKNSNGFGKGHRVLPSHLLPGLVSECNWLAIEKDPACRRRYTSIKTVLPDYDGSEFDDELKGASSFPSAIRRQDGALDIPNFAKRHYSRLSFANNFVRVYEEEQAAYIIMPYIRHADAIVMVKLEIREKSEYFVVAAYIYNGDLSDKELFNYPNGFHDGVKFINHKVFDKLMDGDYWKELSYDEFVEIGKKSGF